MFVVLLKIQAEKTQLAAHMPAHKAWLQQGFDDGCFVLAQYLFGSSQTLSIQRIHKSNYKIL